MSTPRFHSLEDYFASIDPVKAATLRAITELVLTRFPELAAKISWNVPTVHRQGKYVAGYDAFKRHLTFSAWSPRIIEDFHERLAGYVVKKNCFQIPVDWEIDETLVVDLIRARLAELDQGIA